MSKNDYFSLTPAETKAKVRGYVVNRDIMSSNFRALYYLSFNQWAKTPMSAQELWPLSIDAETSPDDENLTIEQIYERNAKFIELFNNINK